VLYMVIERFRNRDGAAVYRRARERGRMLPEGLEYLGSWVEPNLDRCFQLMECDDPQLLETWSAQWDDLVAFEFVPVVLGAEMAERMTSGVEQQPEERS
jgi:hypothetical protein